MCRHLAVLREGAAESACLRRYTKFICPSQSVSPAHGDSEFFSEKSGCLGFRLFRIFSDKSDCLEALYLWALKLWHGGLLPDGDTVSGVFLHPMAMMCPAQWHSLLIDTTFISSQQVSPVGSDNRQSEGGIISRIVFCSDLPPGCRGGAERVCIAGRSKQRRVDLKRGHLARDLPVGLDTPRP